MHMYKAVHTYIHIYIHMHIRICHTCDSPAFCALNPLLKTKETNWFSSFDRAPLSLCLCYIHWSRHEFLGESGYHWFHVHRRHATHHSRETGGAGGECSSSSFWFFPSWQLPRVALASALLPPRNISFVNFIALIGNKIWLVAKWSNKSRIFIFIFIKTVVLPICNFTVCHSVQIQWQWYYCIVLGRSFFYDLYWLINPIRLSCNYILI